jgi:hypothetical protein
MKGFLLWAKEKGAIRERRGIHECPFLFLLFPLTGRLSGSPYFTFS